MTINTIKEEWAMEFNLSLWVDKIGEKERKVLDIPKAKDSPIGVSTPTLVKNINGLQDLTFTIPRWYMDNGERVMNPLLSELTEEKKVKLQTKVGEKVQWHDFIIKGITEQKEGMTNQYSCKELATLELSKRGVDTLLNIELENNYGTIGELGNRILANSGYSVATDGDIPYATTDEVLYQMKVTSEFTAQNTLTGESQSINTGDYIYLPYKSMDWVSNSWVLKSTYDTKGYQFIWNNGKAIKNDDLREGRVFTDIEQKWNFSATNKPEGAIILAGSVSDTTGVSGSIKGRFLVESTQKTYEPIMDRFVEKVEVLNEEAGVSQGSLAYKYKETKYLTSALVKNLLVNTQNFISTDQWTSSAEMKAKTIIKPVMTNALSLNKKGGLFINSGFMRNNVQFTKGEKYVVALKARFSDPTKDTYDSANTGLSSTPTITVGFTKGSSLTPNSSQLSWTKVQSGDEIGLPIQGTHPTTLSVGSSISYNNYSYTVIEAPETSKTLGFGLSIPSHNKLGLHIEDIQVFKYVLFDGKVVLQNDAPQGIAIEETKYYALSQGQEKPLVSNDAYYRTLYRKNYESVRHLDVQRNSYYNNIVALADKFEMWAEFGFNRNQDTGEILERYVKFHRFNPNDTLNFAGFKNGINIKDINRTVNTEEITTRLIVEPSSNQFGVNGITTIARAKSNATRETSIYNFDYYINNNLLDKDQLSSDLYGTKAGDLAYLTKVKKINEELFPLTEKIVALLGELEAKKSDLVVQEELLESANREKDRLEQLIADYEKSLEDLGGTGNNNYGMSSALQNAKKSLNKTLATISSATKQQAKLSGNVTSLSSQLYGYEGKFKGLYDEVDESVLLTDDLVNKDGELLRVNADSSLSQPSSSEKGNIEVRRLFLLSEKKRLHKLFEQKYNRFLTEGVWSDGNHIDDNIYYAEAQIISAINAFPKVEYEIPVADISGFEGYEGYHFNVGEATIIEDEEFFGFSEQELFGQIVRTPYKKSVIIMETREVLDDPSQSTVVVKTYKGNHRDLVTQITTSLNSLERELGNQATQISKTYELSSNFADNRLVYEQIQSDVNAKVEEYQSQLTAEIAAAPGVTLDWLNKNTGVLDGNVLALESVKTGHLEAGVISAIKADIQLLVANTLKTDKAFIEELQSQFAAIKLINTGRIESSDGSSWWDLDSGEINLSGDNVNIKIDEEGVRTVVTSEVDKKLSDPETQDKFKGKDGTSSYLWIRYYSGDLHPLDEEDYSKITRYPTESTKWIGTRTDDYEDPPVAGAKPIEFFAWTKFVGSDGRDGVDAKLISLSASEQVFKNNTPATITVTGLAQNTSITSWTYSSNSGAFTATLPAGVTRSGNTVTITQSTMTANTLTIKASDGTYSDTVSIAKLADGVSGTDGFTVLLTNESQTFPANSSGTVTSYAGGYSDVIVYYGGTQLTCTTTATGLPTVNNTYTVTEITATTGTVTLTPSLDSSNYRITPSALTTENATRVLTIVARVNNRNYTFKKTLTYAKSKSGPQGPKGDKGDTGKADYTQFRTEYESELNVLQGKIDSKVAINTYDDNNKLVNEKFTQIEQTTDKIVSSVSDNAFEALEGLEKEITEKLGSKLSQEEIKELMGDLEKEVERVSTSITQTNKDIEIKFEGVEASIGDHGATLKNLTSTITSGQDEEGNTYTEWGSTGDAKVRVGANGIDIVSADQETMTFRDGEAYAKALYVTETIGFGNHTARKYGDGNEYTIFSWNGGE